MKQRRRPNPYRVVAPVKKKKNKIIRLNLLRIVSSGGLCCQLCYTFISYFQTIFVNQLLNSNSAVVELVGMLNIGSIILAEISLDHIHPPRKRHGFKMQEIQGLAMMRR
jgi:hypothetical protein